MSLIPAVDVGDFIRIGNHAVTVTEQAAGVAAESRQPFLDLAGVPTNPAAATIEVLRPDGTMLEYSWPVAGANGLLNTAATGRFSVDVLMDIPGRWIWKLSGIGAVTASSGDNEVWAKGSAL